MGARDNQNSANGGSCYCKNPAVHGGSIKATEKAREGQRMHQRIRAQCPEPAPKLPLARLFSLNPVTKPIF